MNSDSNSAFNYSNTQSCQNGGKKIVRKVLIKKGKGNKSVKYYKSGKLVSTIKRGLKSTEIASIKMGKFIPGLFKDCNCKKTKKRRVR